MTADDTPLPITLPATEMTQLGALVTVLGQFPAAASSASTWPPPSATVAHVGPGYLASVLEGLRMGSPRSQGASITTSRSRPAVLAM